MATCVLSVAWKCRSNIQIKPYNIRSYFTKNLKGRVIKDKMHTVELFLQDHPNFESKVKPEGRHPGENITLKELLQKLNTKDPELTKPIDIGLPAGLKITRRIIREREQFIKNLKADENLEKSARLRTLEVDLNEVKAEWEKTDGAQQIKKIAEHYGIFRDLYDGAHFLPRVPIRIEYPYDDQYVTPVFRGNHIKPSEAKVSPSVVFDAEPDSLWTLVLTNLDGHLQDSSSEYLHWFIGNIEGNDMSRGEVVCDYLQPFPPRGTGFHRCVFILYKQDKRIDYSQLKRAAPCVSLKERSFKTFDFYSSHEDVLTPAGLAFFQSDWDESVKSVFHHTLIMREPVFEYDFPEPNVAKQRVFRPRAPFNIYLDKYRDPRDIGEEILLKRLKTVHPFQAPAPRLKYPNTVPIPKTTPEWLKTEKFKEALRIGKYRGLDVEVFKPERPKRPFLGIKVNEDGTSKPF